MEHMKNQKTRSYGRVRLVTRNLQHLTLIDITTNLGSIKKLHFMEN